MLADTMPASAITMVQGANTGPQPARRMGIGRFFVTENFHFQTLRALMEIPAGSADTNEVLETLKLIVDGDVQSWYAAWSTMSDRVFALAEHTTDRISKGNAYLRSHNYQRTAEFLLPPSDPKRPPSWTKSLTRFRAFQASQSLFTLRQTRLTVSLPTASRAPFGGSRPQFCRAALRASDRLMSSIWRLPSFG